MNGCLVINGDIWQVAVVEPWDPVLIDRTGSFCLGTTDPINRTIYLSAGLNCSKLDVVMMHEVTHAAMISYGMEVPCCDVMRIEEWACNLIADHGLEILEAARQAMPRCPLATAITAHGIIQS